MTKPPLNNHTIPNLEITSTAYNGYGIAKHEGKIIFIEDVVPGDIVTASIIKDKKNFLHGKPESFKTKSPLREKMICPHQDICGGCNWIGISYDAQRDWKIQFINDALKRIGHIQNIPSINYCPPPMLENYRNRIQLNCQISQKGRLKCGFYQKGTHTIVPITNCLIAEKPINGLLNEISKIKFDHQADFKLEIQSIGPIDSIDEKRVAVTLSGKNKKDEKVVPHLIKQIMSTNLVLWCGSFDETRNAPYFEYDKNLGITFFTQPSIFQQVNRLQNRIIQNLIHQKVQKIKIKKILDLYCGSGNLSLALSGKDNEIEGIESNKSAINCAKYNTRHNRLENIQFFSGSTQEILQNLINKKNMFDLIITDPPRSGMGDAVETLSKLSANYIFYLSCNPTTLARDLNKLCNDGYQIEELYGIDLFPNTYHIETLVFLKRG